MEIIGNFLGRQILIGVKSTGSSALMNKSLPRVPSLRMGAESRAERRARQELKLFIFRSHFIILINFITYLSRSLTNKNNVLKQYLYCCCCLTFSHNCVVARGHWTFFIHMQNAAIIYTIIITLRCCTIVIHKIIKDKSVQSER